MGLWQTVKSWSAKLTGKQQWPKINEDWAIGDLAERLTDGPWQERLPGPQKGDVFRVVEVRKGHARLTGEPAWGLRFSRWPRAFDATDFRKVTPRADECERAEDEFLQILRGAPVSDFSGFAALREEKGLVLACLPDRLRACAVSTRSTRTEEGKAGTSGDVA